VQTSVGEATTISGLGSGERPLQSTSTLQAHSVQRGRGECEIREIPRPWPRRHKVFGTARVREDGERTCTNRASSTRVSRGQSPSRASMRPLARQKSWRSRCTRGLLAHSHRVREGIWEDGRAQRGPHLMRSPLLGCRDCPGGWRRRRTKQTISWPTACVRP